MTDDWSVVSTVPASPDEWSVVKQEPHTAGTQFFQQLRQNLWPSAGRVIADTAHQYLATGPQAGTLVPRDPRIDENAPFYTVRKTLLDLEDTAKGLYDKVTHPLNTIAADPVGVAADFGKLISSIRVAQDMAAGEPAPTFTETPVGSNIKQAYEKTREMVKRPSFLKSAGTVVGGKVGGPIGAILGRELGGDLSDALKAMPAETAPVVDPMLDKIAQGMGAPNFASLPAEGQVTVQRVADNLKGAGASEATTKAAPAPTGPIEWRTPEEIAAAAKPAEAPTPTPTAAPKETPPSDLTQKLNDLARQEKIRAGLDPDQPLGQVKGGRYQNYWDEGAVRTNPKTGKLEHASEVIKSEERKATSVNVEPANPSRIADDIGEKLAGRITVEQFDSMSKNPKALAVITRQYGIEPDSNLISMIRRRIKAKTADVPSGSVISIADLMRTK